MSGLAGYDAWLERPYEDWYDEAREVSASDVEGDVVRITLHDGVRDCDADAVVGTGLAWLDPDATADGVPRYGMVVLTPDECVAVTHEAMARAEEVQW